MNNRSKIALTSILTNVAWFMLLFLWRAPQAARLTEDRAAFARDRACSSCCSSAAWWC